MKILMVSLNYAPELTGIGKYTTEQAEWLAARGHAVRVIAAPPYYPAWRIGDGYRAWQYRRETLRGVDVWRAPVWIPARQSGLRRLLHLASFAVSTLPLLARQWFWRPDVVFAVEPPLMCAPAATLMGRLAGSKTWLHVQDYEVDAAFALGLLKRPWLRRVAMRCERWLLQRQDCVSSISNNMVALAIAKGVPPARAALLPNWTVLHRTDPAAVRAMRKELGVPDDAVLALYSGNMGAKQGLEHLSAAAARLRDRADIHFVFCGDGGGRAALQAACAGMERVRFLPLQSNERFPALMAAADIHLLPQRADVTDLVMPSKLTGMLASARAVVATAAAGSALAEAVGRCGLVVPPGDEDAFACAIATLADAPERRAVLGAAGLAWARQHLERDAVLARFEQTLLEMCPAAQRAPKPKDDVRAVEARR
ncbi:glycosyltransferase WbuB [Cupriavidus pauculus]|uniref:glycosyltransferase WbuB n=1 Tax=Cupriavidus pauculus TaxID=82633 RepID=UPI0007844771|nr:glycosyltransferase WbuB [Cupriavidus pauculus]MBY4733125.1 glycosyltransferase WbuB [Cupriavidus pauculus]MCM3607585.1 glycosyltransferase WbuB [Cupriavidus pauculus]